MPSGEEIFDKIVDEYQIHDGGQFIETIWYKTREKIAEMRDSDEKAKKLAAAIQMHVGKNKDKKHIEKYDDIYYRHKDELMKLWMLFVIETDSLELGKYKTTQVLKSRSMYLTERSQFYKS